jgi:hypothetical protein
MKLKSPPKAEEGPLVALCWSLFDFHGSKFLMLSNIYFLFVLVYFFVFICVWLI